MLSALIIAAAMTTPIPTDQAKAMHAERLRAMRACVVSDVPSGSCLRVARERCAVGLAGDRPDSLIQSYCAWIENEVWEEARLKAETKLEAQPMDPSALGSVRNARLAWEAYRDAWCERESWTAPRAFSGDVNLAEQNCRNALTQDRLFRVRRMTDWLNP